ncbi:MAG: tetratricopeptide repeat-containing sensor histidine kinase [Mucilaginibacter sp.]
MVSREQWVDYREAYGLLTTHKDSAFYYFNRSASRSTNKDEVALAYYNMAMIQSDAGDHYGAQESLTLSLKSLDEHRAKDRNYLATDYNELGMTCTRLNDYEQALKYYELALHFADDTTFRPYILNNSGNAYKKLKRYNEAQASYKEVLRLIGKKGTAYARTLTNLATTKWLSDRHYNAAPELRKALTIRLNQNDLWGENSSYANLAEFYMDNKPDSALWYARKMYTIACRLQSPDDELEALQKLTILSSSTEAKPYFLRYQALGDSLETKRSAAKNQFALIRYDVEKSKTENLLLQKENTEKGYQLAGVILIGALGSMVGVLWYRKRKHALKLEAENDIRQNKLRVSQKVHDVVANGIYRVMNEVEYNEEIDRNDLLDKLELMYEQSRDITYEKDQRVSDDVAENINTLLNAFKSKSIKLAIVGNETMLWQNVGSEIIKQLEPVLQELMVNMSKHSQASQGLIGFESVNNTLVIEYRDNGVGLPADVQLGNGLRSTVSRIEDLGGSLIFETPAIKGVQLHITIPLA